MYGAYDHIHGNAQEAIVIILQVGYVPRIPGPKTPQERARERCDISRSERDSERERERGRER